MKLVRQVRLLRHRPQPLVCEIALYLVPSTGGDAYLVVARQGPPQAEWRESSPTASPVALPQAEAVFERLLAAKLSQGFQLEDSPTPAAPPPTQLTVEASRDRASPWLAQLAPDGWKLLTNRRRLRLVWRIGELRLAAAVPRLVELLETDDPFLDYCLAWSIGRCGDRGALEAMEALGARAEIEAVRRVARWAWFSLADGPERDKYASRLVDDWPSAVRVVWSLDDGPAFDQAMAGALADPETWKRLSRGDWLEQLDLVAQAPAYRDRARRLLLDEAANLPVAAGHFRGLRRLFKAAEYRADGELLGRLAFRFEVTQARFRRGPYTEYVYLNGRYVSVREELQRSDSRLAFSTRTRNYLRRRSWRVLRRLGEAGDPAFVTLAMGYLLACDDAAAPPWSSRSVYLYALGNRPSGWQHAQYSPYARWLVFNRLLNARNAALTVDYNGLTWFQTLSERSSRSGPIDPAAPLWPLDSPPERFEAYPALWDARPDVLLTLLQHSRCAGVHAFAARALADQPDFCRRQPPVVWISLLQSPYVHTAHFSLQFVARLLKEAPTPQLKAPWLVVLSRSALPAAQDMLLEALSRNPGAYAAEPELLAALVTALSDTVRRHSRLVCQLAGQAAPANGDAVLPRLLAWLQSVDAEVPELAPIADNIDWIVAHAFRSAAGQVPFAALVALLDHPVTAVRVAAVHWLLCHGEPVSNVPAEVFGRLMQAEDEAVRAAGVELFGALPEAVLLAQTTLLTGLCQSALPAVRAAAAALVGRLAAAQPEFAATSSAALVDALFRGEPAEGVHADLIVLLLGPLQANTHALDRAAVWRLLQARSRGAQQLGAALLPRHPTEAFAVREWAIAGRHADASVRAWACAAFSAHPDRVRAELAAAVAILDSRWDETRTFACDFFAQRCGRDDWTPELLVNLCDHTHPAVQRLGRDLITRHEAMVEAVDYLLRLAQHPSANMQLFVSAWLEQTAAGKPELISRLQPYFVTVLSQVNRNRVVKDRVLAFLRREALRSEAVAAEVATLFARQVITVAIADKAHYIAGLREIAAAFPALPTPITVATPQLKTSLRAPKTEASA